MRKVIFYFVGACILFFFTFTTAQSKDEIPEGWRRDVLKGNDSAYEVGIDKTTFHSEPKSYSIKSFESATSESSGELSQTISATNFVGKRIRISLFAKGDIKNYSLLWLCVFSKEGMIRGVNELITSSTDWKKYTAVVDVAENAESLRYGVTLYGQGQIWFDDLNIEIVDKDVPEKNVYFPKPPKMDKPYNLP